jgi:cyclopropane fatty-acyl-phospholipid synthase-like methyltransferase
MDSTPHSDVDHWERVYASRDEELPWKLDYVPDELVQWASALPTDATILDIGCGAGDHALMLASRGLRVLGVDLSETAITLARAAALSSGAANVHFEVADIVTFRHSAQFDFAFDYSTFHHINPLDHQSYVANVASLLKQTARYGLVCYADFDEEAAGNTVRRGRFGNLMVHLCLEELVETFSDHFRLESYAVTLLGRKKNHVAHHCLFRRTA